MSEFNEPWKGEDMKTCALYLKDCRETLIATFPDKPKWRDVIARIVACVNFCEGVSTEDLLKHGTAKKMRKRAIMLAGIKVLKEMDGGLS